MRLIDADALFKALGFADPCSECDHVHGFICDAIWTDVCDAIIEAPTIDAVQVVRCKDCVNFERDDAEGIEDWCAVTGARTAEDGYCAWGERKAEP